MCYFSLTALLNSIKPYEITQKQGTHYSTTESRKNSSFVAVKKLTIYSKSQLIK